MSGSTANAAPPVRVARTKRQQRDLLAACLAALETDGDEARRDRARQVVELAGELGDAVARVRGLCALALCDLADGAAHRALDALLPALREVEQLDDRSETAAILLLVAQARAALGDLDGASRALDQASERFAALGDADGRARCASTRGRIYSDAGKHEQALDQFHEVVRLRLARRDPASAENAAGGTPSEAPGDTLLGAAYFDLGTVHAAAGDAETAGRMLLASAAEFGTAGAHRLQARALASMAVVTINAGDAETALDTAMRALVLLETTGDREGVTDTLMTLAQIYDRAGRYRDARAAIEKAITIAERDGRRMQQAAALVVRGDLEQRAGAGWGAVQALLAALEIADECGDRALTCRASEILAAAYESVGAADQALAALRHAMALREELHGAEHRRTIAEAEARNALAAAEREREWYRAQAEQLRSALDERTRELATAELALVHDNQILDTLAKRMNERFGRSKASRAVLAEIMEVIDAMRRRDHDWPAFEERLDELHRDFIKTLRERHPTLTATELKICALMRAGFLSRDVAAVLCVTERTIENHRYRLRRKFGLGTDESLSLHLNAM